MRGRAMAGTTPMDWTWAIANAAHDFHSMLQSYNTTLVLMMLFNSWWGATLLAWHSLVVDLSQHAVYIYMRRRLLVAMKPVCAH